MNSIRLIAKHLSLPKKWQEKTKPCQTVCAFTGEEITKGIPLKEIQGNNFTDHTYIRYPSDFVGVAAACCIVPVFYREKEIEKAGKIIVKQFWNSLRTYSFWANEEELQLLSKEDIIPLLLNPPTPPFVFGVSYINKKHISYKSVVNENQEEWIVRTDNEEVGINPPTVKALVEVMQSWYSVIPEKAGLANEPTWFSKKDILTGSPNHKQIVAYGLERFFKENEILNNYRQTSLFRLVHFALTKSKGSN